MQTVEPADVLGAHCVPWAGVELARRASEHHARAHDGLGAAAHLLSGRIRQPHDLVLLAVAAGTGSTLVVACLAEPADG